MPGQVLQDAQCCQENPGPSEQAFLCLWWCHETHMSHCLVVWGESSSLDMHKSCDSIIPYMCFLGNLKSGEIYFIRVNYQIITLM